MEPKNWHIVRQTVGYRRYDTVGELDLLNRIWALLAGDPTEAGRDDRVIVANHRYFFEHEAPHPGR